MKKKLNWSREISVLLSEEALQQKKKHEENPKASLFLSFALLKKKKKKTGREISLKAHPEIKSLKGKRHLETGEPKLPPL